jgi:hypothetical protein
MPRRIVLCHYVVLYINKAETIRYRLVNENRATTFPSRHFYISHILFIPYMALLVVDRYYVHAFQHKINRI